MIYKVTKNQIDRMPPKPKTVKKQPSQAPEHKDTVSEMVVATVPANNATPAEILYLAANDVPILTQLQELAADGGMIEGREAEDFYVYMNEAPEKNEKTYNERASAVFGHAFPVHGNVVLVNKKTPDEGLTIGDILRVEREFRLDLKKPWKIFEPKSKPKPETASDSSIFEV